MKKKFLVCTLLSAAAVTACAAFAGCNLFGGGNDGRTVIQDNMRFELKDDGTYELYRYENAYLDDGEDANGNYIPAYSGEGEIVTVPETVNGKAVTSVCFYAFGNTGVKEVTLPGAVSELPDRIFDGCKLLEKVNMPAVTSVGKLAFCDCNSLETIEFASGLTEIGERAFEKCTSLAAVTLPDTVTTLGDRCFWGESLIENLNTSGVEVIGESAFYGCVGITSLNLPNVVSIGENAFNGCDKLTEMTIGDRLENCQTDLKRLTKISIDSPIPEKMFYWSGTITDVTLGEGVTSIGELAFGHCSELNNITLPATLTEIGVSAFNQSGLTAVTVPAKVKTVSENAFYACRKLVSLTIENGVESIGASAFEETGITSLSLPASVKTVDKRAFRDCNALAQISFSEGLESLGSLAFSIKGAETLDIVLPSTVKTVGNGCFNYDEYGRPGGILANKIIINETVETVEPYAFQSCNVKELKIPAYCAPYAYHVETLTLFGDGEVPYNSYSNCSEPIKTVNLGPDVKSISAYAFAAGGVNKINLDHVEYIGAFALGYAYLDLLTYTKTENGVNYIDNWIISTDYSQGGATNLDLSGVTGIYYNAFRKTNTSDTSVLNTVALVGSDGTSELKFIGDDAFSGSGITAVEVPSGIETWYGAFSGCGALKYIAIQPGVKRIPGDAFADCTGLSGINLASTDVTEIGAGAFSGCKNMRLATLPRGIKTIEENAFSSCSSLLTIDLNGTEEIGESAFSGCTSLGEVIMNSVITIGNLAFVGCADLTEFVLPATVTKIGSLSLDYAQTVNFAGTPGQWEAISKFTADGELRIWRGNSVTVVFADGGSITVEK